MYTDRQFQNERGNKVSRLVEVGGARQRVKNQDEKKNMFVDENIAPSTIQRYIPKKIGHNSDYGKIVNLWRNNDVNCRAFLGKKVGKQNFAFTIPYQNYQNIFLGNNGDGHSEEKILKQRGVNVINAGTFEDKVDIIKQFTKHSIKQDIFTENEPCHGAFEDFNCRCILGYLLTEDSTVYHFYEYPSFQSSQKRKFTAEEDHLLFSLVRGSTQYDWRKISTNFIGRTPRQLRERYYNYLNPVPPQSWTNDEDKLLQKIYRECGGKWNSIAHLFPGKTETNVKNRFNTLCRKGNNV